MEKIIIQSNGTELEELINKYNKLVTEIENIVDEIDRFQLKIVAIPKCEL